MFVTNWISTTKIQKTSEITNFFRHYFLSRTEVYICKCDTTALTTYFFYIVRAGLSLKFETIYRIERYVCNPIFLLIIIHGDAIGLL